MASVSEIVNLNVGGKRFSTSRQTLSWIPDTFFTALLSGRISSQRDENGAIFIDRDPKLFGIILNYLRNKDIDLKHCDIKALRHEAEYYNISPLILRLLLCEDLNNSSCGNILFYGYLAPPSIPTHDGMTTGSSTASDESQVSSSGAEQMNKNLGHPSTSNTARPGCMVRVPEHGSSVSASSGASSTSSSRLSGHSRNSSWDMRYAYNSSLTRNQQNWTNGGNHSRAASLELRHSRNSSADLNKLIKNDIGILMGSNQEWSDPVRVQIIKAHHNWIAVAYAHFVTCYRLKESFGWQQVFTSPHIECSIDRLAINVKMNFSSEQSTSKMVAISYGNQIRLWSLNDEGIGSDVGIFNFNVRVEFLVFIGSQLVALSSSGKIGVWQAMTQHWQMQDLVPILSFDTAGSFLLLGCNNGSIYYIDMQKFPLRMKDNDLLVTELYKDPSNDPITAIYVYLTPKTTSLAGNWIEIAYGTKSGTVRVIVQHPETVGHGPQLFQTFTVHQSQVTKVSLSENYLISVCSEYNHVRTWKVTRFRGMISTQPGSTPEASYKILSLDNLSDMHFSYTAGNDFGPFGDQDEVHVFIQKVIAGSDQLFVRLASNGERVCTIKSIDNTTITSFMEHECDGSSRMGSRPRRFILTGHSNGAIQMWDLTTALRIMPVFDQEQIVGGPSPEELMRILDQYDLINSHSSTPCMSPCIFNNSAATAVRIKMNNLSLTTQNQNE